jgi:Domain of unknown function (DUF4148)
MKHTRNITAVLLLTALAGVASAQGLSRAQVEAELATAQRNGDMLVPGDSGLKEKDVTPGLYPATPVVAGKSRAQVEAETLAARRNGTLLEASGLREKDVAPGMYPKDPVVAGKSRAQVESELAMAIRDGDMLTAGESGLTENQLQPQVYAQQRAADAATQHATAPANGNFASH